MYLICCQMLLCILFNSPRDSLLSLRFFLDEIIHSCGFIDHLLLDSHACTFLEQTFLMFPSSVFLCVCCIMPLQCSINAPNSVYCKNELLTYKTLPATKISSLIHCMKNVVPSTQYFLNLFSPSYTQNSSFTPAMETPQDSNPHDVKSGALAEAVHVQTNLKSLGLN